MTQEMTPTKTSLVTTDDTEDEDIQQRQIYAKNSFDRFGDDLCGVILSYLSLHERFVCECVSKQFQRTVFESVVDITIHDLTLLFGKISRTNINDSKMLATIGRKCSHIHTIDCRRLSDTYTKQLPEVLPIFRDNCSHLRHIYCDLYENTDQLMPEFGPLVTRIGCISNLIDNQRLSHCHRLSRLRVNYISQVFDDTTGELLAKNLQRFEFSYDSLDSKHLLSAFVAQNQSLRSVKLDGYEYESHESLTELAEQLSRLPQLRELTLDLILNYGPNSLDVFLRAIGQKCPQLKRLGLKLKAKNTFRLYNHSIDSLGCYRRLKRLDLTITSAIFAAFLDPLKLCHRLTHLSLNSGHINDNLFVNCDKHWPRLQCLSIHRTDVTSNGLDHISRLPALQTLVSDCSLLFSGFVVNRIHIDNHLIDNVCEDLLARSAKLKCIEIRRYDDSMFYCHKTGSGSQNTAKESKTFIGDDNDERFPEMKHFLNESKSDVVFLVDGQRVPAIKAVLRLKSDVFDAMFSGQYRESTAKEITITDTTADAFKTMIRFMYTSDLVLSDGKDLKLIDDVLHCADYYRVMRLVNAIGKHLETMVSVETMDTIAEMADKYRIRGLNEAMGTRLAALLTVENVLSVARVGYKRGPPADHFVTELKAFLDKNFAAIFAKESEELLALNEMTDNLWLRVIHDVERGLSATHRMTITTTGRFPYPISGSMRSTASTASTESTDSGSSIDFTIGLPSKTSIGDTEDERFPEMKHFMNESKSDVVFLVDGQRVPAIKAVLRLKSDVFDAMFSGQYLESTAKEITIKDTTADAFKTMIRFMYTSDLVLSDAKDLKLIDDVLHCADYYRVMRLVNAIGKHLESMVSVETMDTIAEMADKYRIRGLSEAMGTRLAAMLTVDNVLSVVRVGYKRRPPTDDFVTALKTILDRNFDSMAAKASEELLALNEMTDNLWLRVIHDVKRGLSPTHRMTINLTVRFARSLSTASTASTSTLDAYTGLPRSQNTGQSGSH
ncbi:unnamed protein product [Medioppia subpectinata]|uniref:BTB domain-containing protein n=1 Tax=Medioppia subpectinata TaxID=1979941 RepID=A0A7R9PTK7_9ACAR|nr:unnamed protein product [Medioppia subpectinata]CAG2100607.1 unnamed protein product [Medioppia subpectinata]